MSVFGRIRVSRAGLAAALFLMYGSAVLAGSPAFATESTGGTGDLSALPVLAPVSQPSAPAELAPAPASLSAQYLLHVGDRVKLWVWGEPSLTTETVVMPDGTVSLPLVGTLSLVGKSVPAATQEVTEACGRYLKNPRVSLSCLPQSPLQVYVEGSVNAPGPVPYDPRFRLLDYLGRAGGPTESADLSNIVVTSVANARVSAAKLDLGARTSDPAAPASNPMLSPGDTVWVGKAVPVSVVGEVRNPGAFDYRHGKRLSEYVSLAGGPTARADLGKSLLRHTKEGVTATTKVDVALALTGSDTAASDPVLAPGDVLTIPEKFLAQGLTYSDMLRAVTAALIWW